MEEQNDNKQVQLSIDAKYGIVTGLLLELAGYVLLFYFNWRLACGIFLVNWGRNVLKRWGVL